MEEELIELGKELNELETQENEKNWGNLNNWENNFWMFVGVYKSKYGWCKDEFDNIHSLKSEKGLWADDEEIELQKNTVRGRIDSYKKLFKKIKEENR